MELIERKIEKLLLQNINDSTLDFFLIFKSLFF